MSNIVYVSCRGGGGHAPQIGVCCTQTSECGGRGRGGNASICHLLQKADEPKQMLRCWMRRLKQVQILRSRGRGLEQIEMEMVTPIINLGYKIMRA